MLSIRRSISFVNCWSNVLNYQSKGRFHNPSIIKQLKVRNVIVECLPEK